MRLSRAGGTEDRNPASTYLSEIDAHAIVELMTIEEHRVLDAVADATTQLAAAAERVARVYRSGGRVFFLQEVAELPPTFGISPDRFAALVAAGPTAGPAAITHTEDDTEAAPSALRSHGCSPTDAVIGLAASGTTPFVLAGMTYANQLGAWTCGIANNPGTPLITEVNLGILLDTGPEVLTGSTRLKAGARPQPHHDRCTYPLRARAVEHDDQRRRQQRQTPDSVDTNRVHTRTCH